MNGFPEIESEIVVEIDKMATSKDWALLATDYINGFTYCVYTTRAEALSEDFFLIICIINNDIRVNLSYGNYSCIKGCSEGMKKITSPKLNNLLIEPNKYINEFQKRNG